MKQGTNWLRKLADGMDLPGEPLPTQPLVELAGNERVLIEHHRGVTAYSQECICVKVRYGQIRIRGCGLSLGRMTGDQLVISGRIHGVDLLGGQKWD